MELVIHADSEDVLALVKKIETAIKDGTLQFRTPDGTVLNADQNSFRIVHECKYSSGVLAF